MNVRWNLCIDMFTVNDKSWYIIMNYTVRLCMHIYIYAFWSVFLDVPRHFSVCMQIMNKLIFFLIKSAWISFILIEMMYWGDQYWMLWIFIEKLFNILWFMIENSRFCVYVQCGIRWPELLSVLAAQRNFAWRAVQIVGSLKSLTWPLFNVICWQTDSVVWYCFMAEVGRVCHWESLTATGALHRP